MTPPARPNRRPIAIGVTLVALLASLVAALLIPSSPARAGAAVSADLDRDLNLASAAGVTLAPVAGGVGIVSAIERAPQARVAPTAPRKAPARRPRPRAEPAPEPVRAEVAAPDEPEDAGPAVEAAPAPAPAPVYRDAPRMPRPTPAAGQQREPRGGWKTPSEVIRNAPFPINP